MAIEIKAIQCPKCGSTEKTELRLDHFRCESCGTEYFLDDGNTHLGAKQVAVDLGLKPDVASKGCSLGAIVFLVSFIVIVVVAIVLISGAVDSTSRGSSGSSSGSSASGQGKEPPTWQYTNSYVYLSSDKRPIIVAIGTLSEQRSTGERREPYVFFFDALTETLIKRFQVPGRDENNSSDSWRFMQLSNGDLYANEDRQFLYKIDKSSHSMKDVTANFGADEPELSSGLATVQIGPGDIGDGFQVVTNDGKQLYYFPLVHKVYKQAQFYEAETGMSTILPSARPATDFCFTSRKTEDGDDTDRLIKFQYMDNGAGPKKGEYPYWKSNGQPEPMEGRYDRLLSRKNFTPGRLYFEPKVLYSDSDYVLISYAPTAARKGRLVQCLDAHTADIVFTSKLDEGYLDDGSVRYKGGFAVRSGWVWLIDMKGKVKKIKNGNYYGS